MRVTSAVPAGIVLVSACGVDFHADQLEYDRRACARSGGPCDGGLGAGGADGSAGSAGSSGSQGNGGVTGGSGGSSTGGSSTGGSSTGGSTTGGSGGIASGGTGALDGGGATDSGPPCTTGAKQCKNASVREECVNGSWSATPCTAPNPECDAGECVVCANGRKRCTGTTPETCVAHAWQPQTACGAGSFCQTGACVSPPSCNGVTSTCGSGRNDYCCSSVAVPGGTYYRSNDGNFPATVSNFLLDKYEVTVGRFRKFAEAYPGSRPAQGAGAHPKIANSGWQSAWDASLPVAQNLLIASVKCGSYSAWTDSPGTNENMPLGCLNWRVAFAFCIWDGGRLPTEAEWNYASAGGDEQRIYPWGDTDPGFNASHAAYDCYYDGTICSGSCCLASIAPVGAIPAGNGRWGHADLAGNLQEWNFDYYGSYPVPCIDCALATGSGTRGMRGGYFSASVDYLKNATRGASSETFGGGTDGVRCARNP